jgi:hypothetical protein
VDHVALGKEGEVNQALTIAKIIGALCFAGMCFAFMLTALQTRENEDRLTEAALSIAQHSVNVARDLDDTVKDVHKSVVLVPKVLNDTRLTLDNANKAAIDERMYFEQEVPGLMARVNLVVDQSRGTLAAYQQTGEALTAAAQGLQPVEDNAALSLAQLDNVLADPDIKAMLANTATASGTVADTAKHLDGTAADVQQAVHGYLHPSWKVKLVNWLGTAAHTLGGWF